jgi:hypothetical protein
MKPQDVDRCVQTLTYLMTDRDEYEQISHINRKVATDRVTNLCPRAQENWLMRMMPGRDMN